MEFLRDPIRLSFALFGTAFLMLVFGFGISTDVNNLTFAVLDHDRRPKAAPIWRKCEDRATSWKSRRSPITPISNRRLQSGAIDAAIEIRRASAATSNAAARPVSAPGSTAPCRSAPRPSAAICRGCTSSISTIPPCKIAAAAPAPPADIEIRFKYNQDFESVYAMVPSTMSLLLALFPAILMALAIVREKELGSITNLYVTPVTRLEFLIGKQLPYIGVAMVNFAMMFLMALFVFQIPLKGSFAALLSAPALCTATTGYGMMISAFTSTQIAALFGTAILTVLPATKFSGMMVPVSSLSGRRAIMGRRFR